MIDATIKSRITAIPWFSHCGRKPSSGLPFNASQVQSWSVAQSCFEGASWEDTTLSAQNALTVFLHKHAKDEYRSWNIFTNDAKRELVLPLTSSVFTPKAKELGLPPSFVHSVEWDVLAAIMEHQYSRVQGRPCFFLELLRVYEAGHFPCGWEGVWPRGELLFH